MLTFKQLKGAVTTMAGQGMDENVWLNLLTFDLKSASSACSFDNKHSHEYIGGGGIQLCS